MPGSPHREPQVMRQRRAFVPTAGDRLEDRVALSPRGGDGAGRPDLAGCAGGADDRPARVGLRVPAGRRGGDGAGRSRVHLPAGEGVDPGHAVDPARGADLLRRHADPDPDLRERDAPGPHLRHPGWPGGRSPICATRSWGAAGASAGRPARGTSPCSSSRRAAARGGPRSR